MERLLAKIILVQGGETLAIIDFLTTLVFLQKIPSTQLLMTIYVLL
jgi:hypothetical protein